jgi:hypothetical protein
VPINPDNIKVILATDCGSTTTKAILIERQADGTYRQTYRGEAPTTVENPFADVTIGVVNSVTEIGELANRRLVDDNDRIIHPATDKEGCDIYISTSSAGGGLQMMVAGVVKEMTAASAKRAALGAGASGRLPFLHWWGHLQLDLGCASQVTNVRSPLPWSRGIRSVQDSRSLVSQNLPS